MSDKLPAHPGRDGPDDSVLWLIQDRDAYKARMEALVEVVRVLRLEIDGDVTRFRELYRIDELLAACERGKS